MANLTNEKAEFAIAIFRHFSPFFAIFRHWPPPPHLWLILVWYTIWESLGSAAGVGPWGPGNRASLLSGRYRNRRPSNERTNDASSDPTKFQDDWPSRSRLNVKFQNQKLANEKGEFAICHRNFSPFFAIAPPPWSKFNHFCG